MLSLKNKLNQKFKEFTTNERVKVFADNSFSNNLKDLKTSHNEALEKQKGDIIITDFDIILNEAATLLKRLIANQEIEVADFYRIIDDLYSAIKLRPTNPNPYYLICWIFVLTENYDTASNYLSIVEEINPYYNGLEDLKKALNVESKKPAETKQAPPPPPVFQPSSTPTLTGAATAYRKYNSY